MTRMLVTVAPTPALNPPLNAVACSIIGSKVAAAGTGTVPGAAAGAVPGAAVGSSIPA